VRRSSFSNARDKNEVVVVTNSGNITASGNIQ
jgi:archaeosine-15-forming tRNA-guanine transglycosylase